MAHSKARKKKKKGGIDFKKLKRKVGRKLPPPRNATDTKITCKAIVLPEQAVASDKAGLGLSRRGLTLVELLRQTSNSNSKIRKESLSGIRDLFVHHTSEIAMHKAAIMEKLSVLVGDNDKSVRERLYELMKLTIFPSFKQDIPFPVISIMMAHVFNGLTHLSAGVRLMTFKFLDLVIEHYPSSLNLYAGKALASYRNMLMNKQVFMAEKNELKTALTGLARCMSLLASEDRKVLPCEHVSTLHGYDLEQSQDRIKNASIIGNLEPLASVLVNCFTELVSSEFSSMSSENYLFDCLLLIVNSIRQTIQICACEMQKGCKRIGAADDLLEKQNGVPTEEVTMPLIVVQLFKMFPFGPTSYAQEEKGKRYFILNLAVTEIFLQVSEFLSLPEFMLEKFLEFVENSLVELMDDEFQSMSTMPESHIITLISIVPKMIQKIDMHWRIRLSEPFTKAFISCAAESAMMSSYLHAIRDVLSRELDLSLLVGSNVQLFGCYSAWIGKLSELLQHLDDKYPFVSELVLEILHHLGQKALVICHLASEFESIQFLFADFFSKCTEIHCINYGPFVRLPRKSQELAIHSLYYFSKLDSVLLQSVACCFLHSDLDSYILFQVLEIINSAFTVGHIEMSDYFNFFVTVLCRFNVVPSFGYTDYGEDSDVSNRETFQAIVDAICSFFYQIGDGSLVSRMIQNVLVQTMSLKPPLDNTHAIIKLIHVLDPKCTEFMHRINDLSYFITDFFMDLACALSVNYEDPSDSNVFQMYAEPALVLLGGSSQIMGFVLELLGSCIKSFFTVLSGFEHQSISNELRKNCSALYLLVYMHKSTLLHKNMSSQRAAIKEILQNALLLKAPSEMSITFLEKQKLHDAICKLQYQTDKLHSWDEIEFQKLPTANLDCN